MFIPYIYIHVSQNLDEISSTSAKIEAVKYLHAVCLLTAKQYRRLITVKILKFGTPQTIAIVVLKIEKFDVTLH